MINGRHDALNVKSVRTCPLGGLRGRRQSHRQKYHQPHIKHRADHCLGINSSYIKSSLNESSTSCPPALNFGRLGCDLRWFFLSTTRSFYPFWSWIKSAEVIVTSESRQLPTWQREASANVGPGDMSCELCFPLKSSPIDTIRNFPRPGNARELCCQGSFTSNFFFGFFLPTHSRSQALILRTWNTEW